MRYIFLIFGLTAVTVMIVAGKRGEISRQPPIELFPDMDRQPKLRPQTVNGFFRDGLSSQLPVPGTIARGSAFEENAINTGKIPGTTNWVENIPVPVSLSLLQRGRERFDINCSPCHGAQGDGNGMVKKFGFPGVVSLHDLRIIKLPDGEIFNTISHGKNLMGAYAGQITIEDRWAIIAYLRALHRSKLASIDDVPAADRGKLTAPLPPSATPAK